MSFALAPPQGLLATGVNASSSITVGAAILHTGPSGSSDNLYCGELAGSLTFSSNGNAGFGADVLKSITGTGDEGTHLTAVGSQVLRACTQGHGHTCVGFNCGLSITTGTENSLFGNRCGDAITTGSSIVAMGLNAAGATNQDAITCIGTACGAANTSGGQFVGLGYQAATTNQTGAGITAVGYQALVLATSNNSTACGNAAGATLSSGQQCVFIGSLADTTAATLSNQIAIGYLASVDAANTMVLGNSSVVLIRSGSDGGCDLGSTTKQFKNLFLSDTLTFTSGNIVTDTTTGTKIGTATSQKFSFWNATPVVQPTTIADADGTLADITTKFNSLLGKLETVGLLAAA